MTREEGRKDYSENIKMQKVINFSKKKHGQILVVGMLFMVIVLILSATLFTRVANYIRFGSGRVIQDQATVLAEAGVENALWQLNKNAGLCNGEAHGCGVEVLLGTTGSFEVTVANKSSTLKTITATGYVPSKANQRKKKTIKADVALSTTNISFRYAVQVGDGGITMQNSSTIQGVGGTNANVYSNKPGVSIEGFNSSTIVGDAYAVGTISSPPTVTGHRNELQESSTMPDFDYDYWRAEATNKGGIPINCTDTPSECVITSNKTIGPKKYIGNVEMAGNAIITINGPIYITGNFKIQNNAIAELNDTFGSTGTGFVVDGTIEVSNGGGFEPTNANPKGYVLVATPSTSVDAIKISNQGVNAIFYALNGKARLSNNTKVTALVAKTLEMENTATLEYDLGLASAQFTTGPGASWAIKKGTYRFVN